MILPPHRKLPISRETAHDQVLPAAVSPSTMRALTVAELAEQPHGTFELQGYVVCHVAVTHKKRIAKPSILKSTYMFEKVLFCLGEWLFIDVIVIYLSQHSFFRCLLLSEIVFIFLRLTPHTHQVKLSFRHSCL